MLREIRVISLINLGKLYTRQEGSSLLLYHVWVFQEKKSPSSLSANKLSFLHYFSPPQSSSFSCRNICQKGGCYGGNKRYFDGQNLLLQYWKAGFYDLEGQEVEQIGCKFLGLLKSTMKKLILLGDVVNFYLHL